MSQTGGGSTLANLAKAFEEPTADYFKARQAKKDVDREVALAGVEADIGADLEQAKLEKQAEIARLDRDLKAAEGDADRQNRIAVKIQEGKNEIAELQFKIDNPEADPAKKGVIPSPQTQVLDLIMMRYIQIFKMDFVGVSNTHLGFHWFTFQKRIKAKVRCLS